jgi:hypothetical protein
VSENVDGIRPSGLETSSIDYEKRGDAIYPSERQNKISDWKRFIRRRVPDFKGDINSAAKLMFSFQKGSDYIFEKFSPRFLTNPRLANHHLGQLLEKTRFMLKRVFWKQVQSSFKILGQKLK